MKIIIFDFNANKDLIASFLLSASLAHRQPINSENWFLWKFRDNPYGSAILVCAEENSTIIGCVGLGIQPFWLNKERIECAVSFETFVHPEYQKRGIFSALVRRAEIEARSIGIDFMLNFPNTKSLQGFIKNGWHQSSRPEYWIKGRDILTIPFSLNKIRSIFKPNSSNLSGVHYPIKFKQDPQVNLTMEITKNYLQWRFFTYPVSEYIEISNESYYSIIRMGTRSGILEAQVLFVNIQKSDIFDFNQFLSHCKKITQYDIISFSISKNHPIRKYLLNSLFIKVPTRTNMCYKILNPEVISDKDIESISLSAINYHTY